MGCCGKNRKKKGRKPVTVKFVGVEAEYKLHGPMSGRMYHFTGPGSRVDMDKRDFNALDRCKLIEKVV